MTSWKVSVEVIGLRRREAFDLAVAPAVGSVVTRGLPEEEVEVVEGQGAGVWRAVSKQRVDGAVEERGGEGGGEEDVEEGVDETVTIVDVTVAVSPGNTVEVSTGSGMTELEP